LGDHAGIMVTSRQPPTGTGNRNRNLLLSPKHAGLAVLVLTSVTALIACPHSKVEESFNLQATHDLYYHGVSPALDTSWWNDNGKGTDGDGDHGSDSDSDSDSDSNLSSNTSSGEDPDLLHVPYDHLRYPGVVPRTFAGPLILAYACRLVSLVVYPIYDLASHPMMVQALSRLILLMFNLHALYRLAGAADRNFGDKRRQQHPIVGGYLLLVTAVQFHLPFYGSRMLPNVFALVLVVHGYAEWIGGRARRGAAWLVAAAAIFRCDVLILLFTVGLTMLIRREMTIVQAIGIGISVGAVSLLLTMPLDSILWRRLLWPEGEVLLFNLGGRSSEWGTSPWHWYATSALPKAMLTTAILVPLSVLRIPERIAAWQRQRNEKNTTASYSYLDLRIVPFLIPAVCFVGLYSNLPHKEMRFIFPAIPMLNLAAALGMARLHNCAFPAGIKGGDEQKRSGDASVFLFLCGIGCVIVSLVGSSIFLVVSRWNYPGGHALKILQNYVEESKLIDSHNMISVHIDVASAMSGVSLFGQRAAGFTFSKSGYEKENDLGSSSSLQTHTHLLSEKDHVEGFRKVGVAQGYPRIDPRQLRFVTDDAINVLERIS